jgi:hypothetical protein
MISSQQITEDLLQTYDYLVEEGISIDREGENIFKDNMLAEEFTQFLKDEFEMQVPASELSDKETLGEALDAIIPYLPEDTTQLYSNMANIYCVVCEALDDEVAELLVTIGKADIAHKKTNVAKMCFMCSMLLGLIYLICGSWSVDADTVLAAYNRFDQMNPFSWLSTGAFFYFCVALIPIGFAFCGGVLGRLTYKLYRYVRNSI